MKRKTDWILIGVFVLALVLMTCVLLVWLGSRSKNQKAEDLTTFSAYTDYELFQTVPTMETKGVEYTDAREVGDDNYMIQAECTSMEDYEAYLKLLEKKGYTKYMDNGENGIDGDVFSSYYQKDNLTLYICHFVNTSTTMINVCEDAIFSEHLFYDESYVKDNIPGAKTKLHAPEMYVAGNSFFFQLKNGHFLLSDGGTKEEILYLLDYMESLTPKGEKPVIEAWFITHPHQDHMGILLAFFDHPEYAERICVENIYFNAPTKDSYDNFLVFDSPQQHVTYCKGAGRYFKTSTGENPTVYRPRIGERYYFNDITIDIVYSPELLPAEEWKTYNASCYVQMFHIEGQRVLMTADVEYNCQRIYMEIFSKEYFDIDVYQMPHHGLNVYIEFANYCKRLQTLLYPTYVIGTPGATGENISPQNKYFEDKAEESMSFGTGTHVLTFPYAVGEYETLPRWEWKYHIEPSRSETYREGEKNE